MECSKKNVFIIILLVKLGLFFVVNHYVEILPSLLKIIGDEDNKNSNKVEEVLNYCYLA